MNPVLHIWLSFLGMLRANFDARYDNGGQSPGSAVLYVIRIPNTIQNSASHKQEKSNQSRWLPGPSAKNSAGRNYNSSLAHLVREQRQYCVSISG
jgi:hypothetical protein